MTHAMTTWTTRGAGRAVALPWVALAAAHATAAVTELKPQDVAAFVARHPMAVVQFTSPDRGCGYCKGADETFDEVAAQPSMNAVRFARVQWSPWRKTPDFGELLQVYGVPEQQVFRNGRSVGAAGGRPADAEQLAAKIEALLEPQAAAAPVAGAPSRPGPLSAEQGEDIRLGVRHTVMQAVARACGQRFAGQSDRWQTQLAHWVGKNQAALDRGARLVLQHTAPGEDSAPRQLRQDEQRALQAWQIQHLGIAMDSPPREQDCQRMLDGLGAGAPDAPRQKAP
jgi:hypothetical protein